MLETTSTRSDVCVSWRPAQVHVLVAPRLMSWWKHGPTKTARLSTGSGGWERKYHEVSTLVGGLDFLFFHRLGRIIPTDYTIFFRGVGIPPASRQIALENQKLSRCWRRHFSLSLRAIVTMSTVGYGDVIPQTPAGKLAGQGGVWWSWWHVVTCTWLEVW